MLLLIICCRRCGNHFCICWRCWRGQAYCCDECRITANRQNHRETQRRYRQTAKGKKTHREAENRRRHRLNKKIKKNMDDTPSTPLPWWCMSWLLCIQILIVHARAWFDRTSCCHFCGCKGVIVDKFPRRGYGANNYRPQMA